MRKKMMRAALAATLVAGPSLTAASPATAATINHITVAGKHIATPVNLHSPVAVERFLLAVEQAQGSTSLAFLAGATPALRATVTDTETRSGGMAVQTSTGLAATAADRDKELAAVLGRPAAPNVAAAVACGWAYKKISYRPGLITYYSLWLQTDFCWTGSTIYGTPYQTHGGSASWGWSYTTRVTTFTWFPYPTRFWSGVEADMHVGPYHNYPYINTYLYRNGWVYTWWNSEN